MSSYRRKFPTFTPLYSIISFLSVLDEFETLLGKENKNDKFCPSFGYRDVNDERPELGNDEGACLTIEEPYTHTILKPHKSLRCGKMSCYERSVQEIGICYPGE